MVSGHRILAVLGRCDLGQGAQLEAGVGGGGAGINPSVLKGDQDSSHDHSYPAIPPISVILTSALRRVFHLGWREGRPPVCRVLICSPHQTNSHHTHYSKEDGGKDAFYGGINLSGVRTDTWSDGLEEETGD